MKRFLYILPAVLVMLVWMSCAKTAIVHDGEQEEIAIKPISSLVSKLVPGPLDGVGYPEGETFGVFAWYSDCKAGGEWSQDEEMEMYLDDTEFAFDPQTGTWCGSAEPYYWPLSGSLVFAGYSPYNYVQGNYVENVSFDPSDKSLRIEGYTTGVYEPMSKEDFEDPDIDYENTSQSDLMYFLPKFSVTGNYVGLNSRTPVTVNFYHALSLVTFRVRTEPGDEAYITLKEIVLKDVIRKGDFSVKAEGVLKGQTSWTLYRNDTEHIGDVTVFSTGAADEGLTLSPKPRTIAEILVIPGMTHEIDVTYCLHVNDKVFTETVSILPTDVDLDPSPDGTDYLDEWEIGKKYTYNLLFSLDMMSVEPVAENWIDI